MKTHKKCKGTGKAIGHGCNQLIPISVNNSTNRVYGIGKSCGCYAKWLLGTEEGKKKLANATLKATLPRIQMEKAEKQHKERKGLPSLINNTVIAVHKFIRERDKGKPCVSCGTPWSKDFQAGHYYPASKYSSLKFNYWNINGQCQNCNLRLDGNFDEYSMRLPSRIGEEQFKMLQRLAEIDKKNTKFKWDRERLNNIRKQANSFYNQIK